MRRANNILSLLLCAALTGTVLSSCAAPPAETAAPSAGPEQPAESGEPEQSEGPAESQRPARSDRPKVEEELARRVLSDWTSFLSASENLYGEMLHFLSYVDKFQSSRTWENLQLARAAFSKADQAIARLEIPEFSVSYAEYSKLTGAVPAFLEPALNGISVDMGSVLLDCGTLRYGLGSDIFWTQTLSPLFQQTALWKQKYQCRMRRLAAETEYLLLSLDNESLTGEFEPSWKKSCPEIMSFQTGGSAGELEKILAECASEEDGITQDMNAVYNRTQASMALFSHALETGDTEALARNATKLEGLPTRLPYPSWYDDGTAKVDFFWKDEEDLPVPVDSWKDLTRPPDGCMITCPDVTRDETLGYRDLLRQYGYQWENTEEEDESLTVTYTFDSGSIVFSWEDGQATVSMEDGISVCFVPDWYPGSRAEPEERTEET